MIARRNNDAHFVVLPNLITNDIEPRKSRYRHDLSRLTSAVDRPLERTVVGLVHPRFHCRVSSRGVGMYAPVVENLRDVEDTIRPLGQAQNEIVDVASFVLCPKAAQGFDEPPAQHGKVTHVHPREE